MDLECDPLPCEGGPRRLRKLGMTRVFAGRRIDFVGLIGRRYVFHTIRA